MKRETEERVDWKKYAAVTVSVSAGLLALWLFLRYGVRVLLPFLLAWVLSLLILPLSERVAARTRLPKRLCAALLLLLLFALLVGTVCVSVRRLLREIEGLLALFLEDPDGIEGKIQQLVEFFSETAEKIPILSSLTGEEGGSLLGIDLGAFVVDLVRESASELTAALPRLVGRVIAGVPQALLFLLVLLISSFYFTLDGDGIARGVRRLLPLPLASRTEGLGKRVSALLYRYLRVYLVLFLLTLTELLVGLTLLGRDYAFLLALVISALDVLPLLGVGSVLLPWAGYLFLARDVRTAIGLLVLWGVVTVVRQIVEPRLIGDSLGLHPLLALVSLYAGLRLFGFIGLLVGPAVTVFVKLALSGTRKDGEVGGSSA